MVYDMDCLSVFPLKNYKSSTAFVTENGMWSYEKLYNISENIASVLKKRTLVFISCKNSPASISFYLSCINNNIVPALIDADLDQELLYELIGIYRPQYFWLPNEKRVEFSSYDEVYSLEGYVLLDMQNSSPNLHSDLALLVTTSGSTGSPKFVRLSYENIISNTESIIKYLDIDNEERAITNLPMHYVYGLSIINTHIYAGASLAVTDKTLFQREFWQLFKESKVTDFGGVPYTFSMLEKMRFFRMNLPSLKTITQAGGKLDPSMHQKIAEYAKEQGKRFFVMYGAAEAAARMGYLPSEVSLDKCGAMGIAIPNGEFSLVDEENRTIEADDREGELIYRGKNVMMGYAENREDLSKGDEMNGVLRTGDIAKRDSEGFYTIVGRKRRFLKMFGKRTNLEDVERILKERFKVEVASTGEDNELLVFVTEKSVKDEIVPYLAGKLKLHPSAIKAFYIENIPKNAAGKTLYATLKSYSQA